MGIEPAIDLTAGQRKTVLSLLEKHLPNTTAWVYGSRAKWTARPQSDLDMVVFATPEQNSRVFNLREAFEESNLPFRVDLFVWDDVPERFRKRIEAEHVVLVERGERGAGDGWRTTTLGEVVTLQRGFDLPRTERKLGSYPVIASTGPVGTHDRAVVQGPGVVIGRSGSLGGGQFIKHDFWPLNTTLWVKDFNNNDPRFCYFFLKSLDLAQFNAGSGVPTLNRNHIHPLPVRVPPLPEQRAIAHVLGTLDDKIELNRRMNETLEEMARVLFKSWFVDFDPVRAKMEGRDTGLPPDVAALFPDRLVESELGEIPERWEVKSLDKIADFQNGLALQKFRPRENGNRLPVVKIAQLRSGQTDSEEWATENITPECIIDDGDVVFSWSGSLMVKIWCGGRAALNQHLFKVTSSEYPKWFYLHCVESHLPEFQSIAADKTTTMGHIKRQHLSEAKCVVPDPTCLAVANGTFAGLLSKRVSNVLKSNVLAILRDTLLPKLISGEMRVDTRDDESESIGKHL